MEQIYNPQFNQQSQQAGFNQAAFDGVAREGLANAQFIQESAEVLEKFYPASLPICNSA